jgi:glycosyltransferase involved in cell wall biosynthesis
MIRILYIFRGLAPPPVDKRHDRFTFLSDVAEGEVLLPVWFSSSEALPGFLKESYPNYMAGNFRYNLFFEDAFPKWLKMLARFSFFLRRGLEPNREKKIDVIVTYGTNSTGIAGVLLKWMTGAKLIVEIPGVPENSFRFDEPRRTLHARARHLIADLLLNLISFSVDHLRLLYPTQLAQYPRSAKKKSSVFHEFVPISSITESPAEQKTVLLVGHPWYTKGVDILIRAFKLVAPRHPDWKLRVLGFFPDRRFLDSLVAASPQIEFVAPRVGVFDEIAKCSIYVLASRTEAMGRVLLEAMAARKPIIASAVGGVPHYVSDNRTGLLFESENVEQLAEKLTLLMEDTEMRERLGTQALASVKAQFDETSYAQSFRQMLMNL